MYCVWIKGVSTVDVVEHMYVDDSFSFFYVHVELEPEHLREERRCVLNSTQKLAFNNYMTFIQTAECTREVFKDVSHMTVTCHVQWKPSTCIKTLPNEYISLNRATVHVTCIWSQLHL